jgi:hypothetical protein
LVGFFTPFPPLPWADMHAACGLHSHTRIYIRSFWFGLRVLCESSGQDALRRFLVAPHFARNNHPLPRSVAVPCNAPFDAHQGRGGGDACTHLQLSFIPHSRPPSLCLLRRRAGCAAPRLTSTSLSGFASCSLIQGARSCKQTTGKSGDKVRTAIPQPTTTTLTTTTTTES